MDRPRRISFLWKTLGSHRRIPLSHILLLSPSLCSTLVYLHLISVSTSWTRSICSTSSISVNSGCEVFLLPIQNPINVGHIPVKSFSLMCRWKLFFLLAFQLAVKCAHSGPGMTGTRRCCSGWSCQCFRDTASDFNMWGIKMRGLVLAPSAMLLAI